MSFGKYTLFSAHASIANGNMSPIAFAILFGGETLDNWNLFWTFAVKLHPSINSSDMTIITDQNAGCISSLSTIVQAALHFHCSWHRCQNIIKTCGGSVTTPGSALWLFNLLLSCKTLPSIVLNLEKYLDTLHPTDRHYLTKLVDSVQYPAARCAMGDYVCMHSCSASLGSESMNRANMVVRRAAAIDVLNACIQLLRLECRQYE